MATAMEQAYQRGRANGEWGKAASVRLHDLARGLAHVIGWPKAKLIEEVVRFDRDRLDAVPALAVYPELRGYRERLVEEDRGKRDAGMDDELIAIARSMTDYSRVRLFALTGKMYYAEAKPEKCRVLYVPNAKGGAIHTKNVDDPNNYFKPDAPVKPGTPWPFPHPLFFDGVGSGLHIDETPPDIFPVNPLELCREHCTTVPAAIDFLVRYNHFWHSQNLLVHDYFGNSVAFEKTACRVAVRGPNKNGVNYITGMGALDPGIAAHQKAMREKYLQQVGEDWDGPNGSYWKVCEGQWRNMTRYVNELPAEPTLEEINALMEKRDPDGPLCKTGVLGHPSLTIAEWTLVMHVWFPNRKAAQRRQYRDGKPAYLDPVEYIQYV